MLSSYLLKNKGKSQHKKKLLKLLAKAEARSYSFLLMWERSKAQFTMCENTKYGGRQPSLFHFVVFLLGFRGSETYSVTNTMLYVIQWTVMTFYHNSDSATANFLLDKHKEA